jgi:hypothetical protein
MRTESIHSRPICGGLRWDAGAERERDAGAGRRSGTPERDAGAGRRSGTPGRDAGAGRRGGTPERDAGAGHRSGTPERDAGAGRRSGTPERDAGAGRRSGTPERDAGVNSCANRPAANRPCGRNRSIPAQFVAACGGTPVRDGTPVRPTAVAAARADRRTEHTSRRPHGNTAAHLKGSDPGCANRSTNRIPARLVVRKLAIL